MSFQAIKNLGHWILSKIAIFFYQNPAKKLTVIGITGTDGKTTVTNLIYHILLVSGFKAGMISTIGAKINNEVPLNIGFHTTTPSPFLIQKLLHQMVNQACKYAVIEVTSHAIDQNRVLGCNFSIGVITNIANEHLDYHHNLNNYLKTKLKLLEMANYGVVNSDDEYLYTEAKKLKLKNLITFGIKSKADVQAQNINLKADSTTFSLINHGAKLNINSQLIGEYNVLNILAAISVAKILKISGNNITEAIKTFKPVKGRMELVKIDKPFKVFIDFGHTPQAFKAILPTLRSFTDKKIIHVFGATGKRDKSKREPMAEISGKLADFTIITTEDTYGDDPIGIVNSLVKGIKKTSKKLNEDYWVIPDRQEAINKAVSLALVGDIVIITGVGHQVSLNLGDREVPWSEVEAVKKAVKKLS